MRQLVRTTVVAGKGRGMRLLAAVLAVSVFAIAAGVASAKDGGDGGSKDSVKGEGTMSAGHYLRIKARSGSSGEDPRGALVFRNASGESWKVRVTCLAVNGSVARFGGLVIEGASVGSGFIGTIQDAGKKGGPDLMDVGFVVAPPPCQNLTLPLTPSTSGNFKVRDADAS